MEAEKKYCAFISYRHLEVDEMIAKRVQTMLENYRQPKGVAVGKKIGRIFRDTSELPTSKDLDEALKEALCESDFLIVILSEHTKESIWCMEEIRTFKKAHGGKTDRILPVLVSGEPYESIPDELLFEEVYKTDENGNETLVKIHKEPVCADVRGETDRIRKRKLSTEFLRLAAPMLGCGYDDLYQRHKRRQQRRNTILFAVIAAVVSIYMGQLLYSNSVINDRNEKLVIANEEITASKLRYQENLISSYIREGQRASIDGDSEAALAYYNRVLKESPENRLARVGVLAELQKKGWLYIDEETYVNETRGEKPIQPDFGTEFTLIQSPDKYQNSYVFLSEDKIRVYLPDREEIYEFDIPNDEYSPYSVNYLSFLVMPLINEEHTMFVVYDRVYLTSYSYDGKAPDERGIRHCNMVNTVRRTEAFANYHVYDYDFTSETRIMWANNINGIVVLNDGGTLYVYDIYNNKPLGASMLFQWIGEVFIPGSGDYIDVFSGDYRGGHYGCTRFTSYDSTWSGLSQRAEPVEEHNFETRNIVFSKDESMILWATRGGLLLLDAENAEPCSAKLPCPEIEFADFSKSGMDGLDVIFNNGKTVKYDMLCLQSGIKPTAKTDDNSASEGLHFTTEKVSVSRKSLFSTYSTVNKSITLLELRDETNAVLDQALGEQVDAFLNYSDDYRNYRICIDQSGKIAYYYSEKSGFEETSKADEVNWDHFYRVRVDEVSKKIGDPEKIELPARYRNTISELRPTSDGNVVLTAGGVFLFYRNDDSEPYQVISPSNFHESASFVFTESGYLAILHVWRQNGEMLKMQCLLELWDIESGSHITNIADGIERPSGLALTEDGQLQFFNGNEIVNFLLEVEVPDETARQTLDSLCCYTLNDDGEMEYKDPVFSGEMGNWGALFKLNYPLSEGKAVVGIPD